MSQTITTAVDPAVLKQKAGRNKTSEVRIEAQGLNLYYGEKRALNDISFSMKKNHVTAFIGPSGCGKSTLLRCFNRMNDLVDGVRIEGEIRLDDKNIYDSDIDVTALRQRIGMVFQKPNPFPMSIFDNVSYGLRLQGVNKRRELEERVEWALK
ncbi:MAG TPA: ATP-binding cassette domain-containing protein, partial [Thiotrichales bacterium]|nr:ATP-binding cassette domain-containing protein [Thiotrichales bacterium]